MQGTLSIGKLPDEDAFRVIFYGTEMPEGMDPGASYIARGFDGLTEFLSAIGLHYDTQQTIKDELRIVSSTNLLRCDVPDDVLKHFGLL